MINIVSDENFSGDSSATATPSKAKENEIIKINFLDLYIFFKISTKSISSSLIISITISL